QTERTFFPAPTASSYCSMFLSRRANSGVLLQPAPPTRHFSYITASIVACRATKVGSTTVKISASLRQRFLTFSVNTKCREICSCIPTKVLCRARLKDTGSGCFEINLTPEVHFVADVAERPAQGGHCGKRHGTVVKPGFCAALPPPGVTTLIDY